MAVSLLLFWLSLSAPLAANMAGEDWPRFLGPRGNNVSSETDLLDRWPTNGPPLLWEKTVGTGYGAPSVRGDRLVLHHRLGAATLLARREGWSAWTC